MFYYYVNPPTQKNELSCIQGECIIFFKYIVCLNAVLVVLEWSTSWISLIAFSSKKVSFYFDDHWVNEVASSRQWLPFKWYIINSEMCVRKNNYLVHKMSSLWELQIQFYSWRTSLIIFYIISILYSIFYIIYILKLLY